MKNKQEGDKRLQKEELAKNDKFKFNEREWSREEKKERFELWKMIKRIERKEELVEWNEDIIIQVLEVSTIKWMLEWLNLELKQANISFRMRKLELRTQNSSFGLKTQVCH